LQIQVCTVKAFVLWFQTTFHVYKLCFPCYWTGFAKSSNKLKCSYNCRTMRS
jgi:hypothetical protein